jgi:hypothetical protein
MRPKENDYLSLTFAFKMIGYNYFFHLRLVVVFNIKKLVVNSVSNDPISTHPYVFKFAILSDLSVVLDACLATNKNMLEE